MTDDHDTDDLVVLVNEAGEPIGSADRETIHGPDTPLHLAFSCYLFDRHGRVLLTRRALTKRSWPGVWTNAFCGHPRPGETVQEAIRRRGREELGIEIGRLSPVLPEFRYRAVDPAGVVEHERCPVYSAELESELDPNPDEVAAYGWVDRAELRHIAASAPFLLSPWVIEQLAQWPRDPLG